MPIRRKCEKKLKTACILSSQSHGHGPRLSTSRSHLMLSRIRHKGYDLQRKCSDDISLKRCLSTIDNFVEELSIYDSDHMKSYSSGWNHTNQVMKENLYDIIWKSMECHQQIDLHVKIGNFIFRCYTFLLNCYTKYFSNIEQRQSEQQRRVVEIKATKLPGIAFMKFYNWMLKDESSIVTITQKDILHLVIASEVLNVEELRQQCRSVLDNSSIYCENVAYELYNDAKRYDSVLSAGGGGGSNVQQLMLPRIWKYFLMLLGKEDYQRMDADEVCQWLSANTIGVNSEMEVFYGAVLWVNSKWNERKGKPLRMVMSCVRFGLLPPWFLVSLHTSKHGCDVDRVVKDTKVAKLIADGLSLTTAMLFYSKDSSEFDEFLKRGHFQMAMQRKWIVDSTCPYHYHEGSNEQEHITYERFTDYLQHLRLKNESHWRCLISASDNHWSFVFNLKPNPMMLDLS